MSPRFLLIPIAIILLAACDRRAAEGDATKAAEIAEQQKAEQAANDKLRQQPVGAPPDLRGSAVHADLDRVEEVDEDREPVSVGQVVPPNQRVATVETFYQPLDPYGDWIQTDNYGYVFRPAVALRADWRPYVDGHWVHTGYGWAWESNENFGWATYHYGRWVRVESVGWVWTPGREWGPAWVSWRRGNEHCGWAPLPPESLRRVSFTASVDLDYGLGPAAYVFVTLGNFGARSYAQVIELPAQNVTIISKTVNVTNITYNNTTNNTTVYNGGPSYAVLRARSRQPVENVQLSFARPAPGGAGGVIANVRQGNTFQIAAPPAEAAAGTVPSRVKEKLGKPKEDKGWSGIDPAQAQKMKQEIAATSVERPHRPRPTAPAATPAGLAAPREAAISTPPPRLVHPVVPAREAAKPVLEPAKTPQATPQPKPLVPDAVKPIEPGKPIDAATSKMREPASPHPRAIPGPTPELKRPEEPRKPVEAETPKAREAATVRPKATPGPSPLLNPSGEPKRPVENMLRPAGGVEKTATPKPIVAVPGRKEMPATPVVRERPKTLATPEERARPHGEPPAEVKPPVPHEPRVTPRPGSPKKATPESDKEKKKKEDQQ